MCFRSQYVGAVNSKLSAWLRVSALRVFAIAVLTTPLPYRPCNPPAPFRRSEEKLPDINFVNNELPASTRNFTHPFRRFVPLASPPRFLLQRRKGGICRIVITITIRERISRASRGNFSSARPGEAALAKQLRIVAISFRHCAAGARERRAEL